MEMHRTADREHPAHGPKSEGYRLGTVLTEGRPPIPGSFRLMAGLSSDEHSVDGRFSCADLNDIEKVRETGHYSLLEGEDGSRYIIRLLDCGGFFHLVEKLAEPLESHSSRENQG